MFILKLSSTQKYLQAIFLDESQYVSKILKIREECTEKPMLEMSKKGQREKGELLRGLTDIQNLQGRKRPQMQN